MQGSIAQALAITCVGNAVLRGRDPERFWPEADVFQFTKLCEFRDVGDNGDILVAADPLAWFELLRGRCRGLRLHHAPRPRGPGQSIPISERQSVGFVGGGPAWLIEAVGETRATLWQGHDRIGDRADAAQKIWLTAYLRAGEIDPLDATRVLLPLIASELSEALREAEALAVRLKPHMGLEWDAVFREARAALTAENPAPPYYALDGFVDLDLEQRRLWLCCVKSWVFGGMGSWNDFSPPQAEAAAYERVSERLFQALCDAISALANSTYAGASLK